jgi:uncharacterized protein (DUF849 family)
MTRIKAALNGGREHPAPVTAQEIATAAALAIDAGAFAVHVHPRDSSGKESLAAADVDAVIAAVRTAVPEIAIGVTTGAWIEPDPARRLSAIRKWAHIPDFASVNMDEEGAEQVANLLLERGVAVEIGLATVQGADLFMRSPLWKRAERVLLEPQEQKLKDALATVDAICDVIAECDVPWLLHGVDKTAWPLIRESKRRGWDTRAGLEDTLILPDGSPAIDNEQMIRAARGIIGR